ncbi:nitronate monooxygenase [Fusobacterium simiae]|uniref:Nitronate monooxygenase n=1 Tax=Fusobacterium simiae TaxID=855 RepID=A0ABT4DK16_FUSSI|nr:MULTISPECIES: nitronate monooxygenase [Fusobacterium]MCY7008950.1 nitronate monooxygenase [Fusobacterium simiae]MDC7954264.1 nitronate monooxygenase [Fusobacterium simiae]
MRKNRIAEILNIKYPIIQGPMAWLTDAKLVSAVSNAGGLGILGPNAGQYNATTSIIETTERMRNEIRKTKELTDKPFGVVILVDTDMSFTEAILDMVIKEKVEAVLVNGLDNVDYTDTFKKLKDNNIKIIFRPLTPTIANARMAEANGVDIYVATGFDEGGTLPENQIGTFSIVPLIVDSVKNIPIVAAGGIGDVRGVRAAFALGAEGVFLGSRFLTTIEARTAPNIKELIVKSTAEDLDIFRTLPYFYRSIHTKLSTELVEMDKKGATREELAMKQGGGRNMKLGMLDGDTENGYISVGLGISSIKEILSVEDTIKELMQDFID